MKGIRRGKGLTLIELIVAIVISSIVGLAITVHFVSEYRFRSAVQDRIVLSREARIAMDHMTRVLRFAIPGTIQLTPSPPQAPHTKVISATIEGGHLGFIPSPTAIEYRSNNPGQKVNNIEYVTNPGTAQETNVEIATDITYLKAFWNEPAEGVEIPDFEIRLTAENENASVSLRTRIRVLGG